MTSFAAKSQTKDYLMALLFGALLPVSLAPYKFWMVGIASTTALTYLLEGKRSGQCFYRAFFFGCGMFATGASWVYVSIHTYGYASVPLAVSLTALFVIALAIIFALPFLLYAPLAQKGVTATLWAFPAIWVLGELWRGWVFTGFPWLFLGYAHVDTWLAGWGPVGGVYLLSFITAFMGAWIALLLEWKSGKFTLQLGMLFILAACFGGLHLQDAEWTEDNGKALGVTLVQPAQPINTKWNPAQSQVMIDSLLDQTEPYWDNSDIIVWPESAIPQLKHQVKPLLEELDRKATNKEVALISGIPSSSGGTSQDYYNAVISIGDNSFGEYRKQHLVPFGEYIPMESWLRGTIQFLDLPMSNFSSGDNEQKNLRAKGILVGTAICYEITYPFLVANRAAESQLLLTVSNDTWFGDSLGPWQHLQMAQMRALENAKPVIRATNSGMTALINHRGILTDQLPRFRPGELRGFVRPRKGTTPFQEHGLAITLSLIAAGLLFAALCKSKEKTAR